MSSSITGIARSAVPYGLPIVDMHRTLMRSASDPSGADRLAPLNRIQHGGGPSGPSDVPILGLAQGIPGPWAWLDLRGGPVLVTLPAHDPESSETVDVLDLYAGIVGQVPSGPAGGSGSFLVRGPAGGEADREVDAVLECTTDLALLVVRARLATDRDPADLAAPSAGMAVTPLGDAPPLPAPVPAVDLRGELGPQFLIALRWMLELMPTLPQDVRIREELSGLGIGVGLLDQVLAEPAIAQEVREGLALGIQDVRAQCAALQSSGASRGSGETRVDDYLARAARAYLRILGDAPEDAPGRPSDGA